MRSYEIVYVLDATLDQDAAAEKVGGFHEALGGEVETVDHWGVRRLAYPIAKANMAYYAVAHVRAPPAALPEFERRLKLDAQVMRYLVVLNEGQPASGDSIFAEPRPDAAALPEDEEGAAPAEDAEAAAGAEDGEDAAGPTDEAEDGDVPKDADGDARAAGGLAEDAEDGEDDDEAEEAAGEDGEDGDEAGEDGIGQEGQDEWQGPVAGPPEYSGSRGRGRRHDAPRILLLNYKDVATLSHFVSEQGRILPKRTTKVTARFQRQLGTAVKRARYLALMPYVRSHGGLAP